MRALIAAVIFIASCAVGAQTPAPWHADVAPPRLSLPRVTIDLGYRGPYVPVQSSPITLTAIAGDLPFDGYIGYHIQVRDHVTYDLPVVARAVLRPRETWKFSTYATLHSVFGAHEPGTNPTFYREIAVEWRDRSMRVIAATRAGAPPWTFWNEERTPLLVDRVAPASPAALGRGAYFERADALPDRAQWYAGFSDAVIPVEVWLDLSRRVREAILGSSIRIVFFGLPRSNQHFDDLDRALIPVAFEARAGSYRAPWPYRDAGMIATPMSWTPNRGARTVGQGPLPYIVSTAAATWIADAAGIARPLPSTSVEAVRNGVGFPPPTVEWPRPSQILRAYPGRVVLAIVVIVAIVCWIVTRKHPRIVVFVVLVVVAFSIIAARQRIRPREGVYRYDMETSVVPGIIETTQVVRQYGAAPLPQPRFDPERLRTSLTNSIDLWWEDAEIRTPASGVAMGTMQPRRDWDGVTRFARERELGNAPEIRVRRRDDELVVDYASSFPINRISSDWIDGHQLRHGTITVPWSTRGTATIRDNHEAWHELEPFVWELSPLVPLENAGIRVLLEQRSTSRTRTSLWLQTEGIDHFFISDRATVNGGTASFAFALPRNIPAQANALIDVPKHRASSRVTLHLASGDVALAPTGRDGALFATTAYAVPPDALREILAQGGIVSVTMTTDENATPPAWRKPMETAAIEIREQKP